MRRRSCRATVHGVDAAWRPQEGEDALPGFVLVLGERHHRGVEAGDDLGDDLDQGGLASSSHATDQQEVTLEEQAFLDLQDIEIAPYKTIAGLLGRAILRGFPLVKGDFLLWSKLLKRKLREPYWVGYVRNVN